jgi:hypothetical protein
MLILCYLIASGAAQGKEDSFLTEIMVISISRRVGASIRKVSRRSLLGQWHGRQALAIQLESADKGRR